MDKPPDRISFPQSYCIQYDTLRSNWPAREILARLFALASNVSAWTTVPLGCGVDVHVSTAFLARLSGRLYSGRPVRKRSPVPLGNETPECQLRGAREAVAHFRVSYSQNRPQSKQAEDCEK